MSRPFCRLFFWNDSLLPQVKTSLSIHLKSPSWQVPCAPGPPSSLPLAQVTLIFIWLPLCPLETVSTNCSSLAPGPRRVPVTEDVLCKYLTASFVWKMEKETGAAWMGTEVLVWERRGGQASGTLCFKPGWELSSDAAMGSWPHSSAPWALCTLTQWFTLTKVTSSLLGLPFDFGWGQWVWPVLSYPVSWRWSYVTSSPASLLF